MADQEFLASYAVDVDEEGVARLQSVLEGNRELAASLGAAFRAAYGELENFVRGAAGAVPGLNGFIAGQNEAAAAAGRAAGAIRELGEAYEGLRGLIPEGTLEISVPGMKPLSVENGSGAADALEITLPEMRPLAAENGFESAIRLAVSLGGDSDTLACITGGIAEAFYKTIPDGIALKIWELLPEDFKTILRAMENQTSYRLPNILK